ncbi:MAG TPA: SRPBCC domain-containing protein [Chitinophagaceae bacterium]|nr:SRPBCC domain-containing protein [Chitinophagaceae bacterium]
MEKEVNRTWLFHRPPEEVWEYLTNPELLELWLMKSDFQPVPGHKFHFVYLPKIDSNYNGAVNCEVLEVNPVSKLSYSWETTTRNGSRKLNSIVIWTLAAKENGTELHLRHTGFTLSEDVSAHSTGWNTCLKRAEELLNTVK